MLDELAATYRVDARRNFFAGVSNGASMTFLFGSKASRRVAVIAPVAGACRLEALELERPGPMCYITQEQKTGPDVAGHRLIRNAIAD